MKKQSMILVLVLVLIGIMALTLTACTQRYTVTWDVNGTITKEKYEVGAMPEFKGSTDREGEGTTTYTFIGWDSELAEVTGNVTYTAKYSEHVVDKQFAGLGSYTGTLVDGKLSGTGKLVDADGNVYEGTFADNKRSGTGKLTFTNGCYYEGEWANNLYEGQGKFVWPVGDDKQDVLEGTFVAGAPVSGKKTFAESGYVYEGEFQNWEFHGQGKGTYAVGDVYEGAFANGYRNGQGKLTYPDGCVYQGNFENDTFNGKGKFTWPNGCSYEGDFNNGAFTGKATFIWDLADGYSYYVGDFVNLTPNGEGEKHFGRPDTNENYWKGTFVDGNPQKGTFGYGRMDGTEGYIWVDAESGAWSWYSGQLADGTEVNNGQVAK